MLISAPTICISRFNEAHGAFQTVELALLGAKFDLFRNLRGGGVGEHAEQAFDGVSRSTGRFGIFLAQGLFQLRE